MKTAPRALLCLAILAVSPTPAEAEDRWTDPAPGVRHLSRQGRYGYDDRPQYRMEALVIDLTHPAVSIVATPPDVAGSVVSVFADRMALEAAWNANFFGGPRDSCGLMVGEGQVWEHAYEDGCHASIGFGDENQARIFVQGDPHGPPPDGWMRQVVTGKPGLILEGGQPRFSSGCGASCAYNPRTGIGLDRDRHTLYVVVVDGRQAGTVGAGLDDLANLMRDLGAWDAVNLDGGGSSTLFVRTDGGVVNHPSDGHERTVCCHMGVRIEPAAAWWRAERVETSPAGGPFREGERGELWVRYRNTGRHAWRPDGDHPVRLGTQAPEDRESPWRAPEWIGATRPVAVDGEVGRGGEAVFRFPIRAPGPGRYDEVFAPVAEGATWMASDPVSWTLEVDDAPPPRPDAGPSPALDATPRRTDAIAQPHDAGVPPGDAKLPPRDAWSPKRDAAPAPLDDSAVPRDARAASPADRDGFRPAPLGGGRGSETAEYSGGCRFGPSDGAPAWWMLALGVLALGRRTRKVHACPVES